jgi:hypothetical protein
MLIYPQPFPTFFMDRKISLVLYDLPGISHICFSSGHKAGAQLIRKLLVWIQASKRRPAGMAGQDQERCPTVLFIPFQNNSNNKRIHNYHLWLNIFLLLVV